MPRNNIGNSDNQSLDSNSTTNSPYMTYNSTSTSNPTYGYRSATADTIYTTAAISGTIAASTLQYYGSHRYKVTYVDAADTITLDEAYRIQRILERHGYHIQSSEYIDIDRRWELTIENPDWPLVRRGQRPDVIDLSYLWNTRQEKME